MAENKDQITFINQDVRNGMIELKEGTECVSHEGTVHGPKSIINWIFVQIGLDGWFRLICVFYVELLEEIFGIVPDFVKDLIESWAWLGFGDLLLHGNQILWEIKDFFIK